MNKPANFSTRIISRIVIITKSRKKEKYLGPITMMDYGNTFRLYGPDNDFSNSVFYSPAQMKKNILDVSVKDIEAYTIIL